MPTTGKGTWTINDNDDFDLPIDMAAMANSIDGWTTTRYERRGTSVVTLGTGDYIGQRALVSPYSNTFNEHYWNGSQWRPVKLTGVTSSFSVAANGLTNITITFPTNSFGVTPICFAQPMGVNARGLSVTTYAVSNGSVTFRVHEATGNARDGVLYWTAMTR